MRCSSAILSGTLSVGLLLVLVGCNGSSPTAPSAPSSPAPTPPIQWGGNGHHYQLSLTLDNEADHFLTWTQARARAASLSFQGVPGHLVTITSRAENRFLVDRIVPVERNPAPLIGGFQPPGSPEPDGGWRWVTGEPFAYTNWAMGEPNEGVPGADFIVFTAPPEPTIGTWNDVGDIESAYIIEYDTSGPGGTIVLSGDTGIGMALVDGGGRIPFHPGNVTFFRNVLDANTGSRVALSDNPYGPGSVTEAWSDIRQSYSNGGAAVSVIPIGGISAATLAAVDLLVILVPTVDFTAVELSAMSGLLSRGGTLFFLGEHRNFETAGNNRISAALRDLNSSLTIDNNLIGEGRDNVTTNLTEHPLLAGVSDIRYTAASTVTGGTTLVSSRAGERFIAVENVEP